MRRVLLVIGLTAWLACAAGCRSQEDSNGSQAGSGPGGASNQAGAAGGASGKTNIVAVSSESNLLTNGDFEQLNARDATLPDGWTRLQSTAETVMLVKRGTGHAVRLRNSAELPQWQNLIQNVAGLKPRATYVLAFEGQTNGKGAGMVNIMLFDPVTKKRRRLHGLRFEAARWDHYQVEFEMPASLPGDVQVFITPADYKNSGITIQVDNIILASR